MDDAALTFGLEEEFFLIHPHSRQMVPRVPKRLLRECRQRFGTVVTSELLQSQIEIASPVFSATADAFATMLALRRGIADVAESMGYRVIAASTHPLSVWHRLKTTDKPRYTKLIDDFKIIGRRNVICGLHIHVGIPAGIDRVQLMNRIMPWLPMFLALSTSSPFWARENTGLLSYRQAAYDEWPRTGIPDFFADQSEYDAFVALLAQQGAIADGSYLWWAIRPSARFPTLELRIADCCTRVRDSVALATLFRCLVRAHLRQPQLGSARSAMTRRLIDENRWRAKRYGLQATLVDEHGAQARPLTAVLDDMRELVAEDARALDCEAALHRLSRILAHGTSAHQQLAIFNAHTAAGASRIDALRAVIDWLADATIDDDPE